MAERRMVTSPCPTCGMVDERVTYDVGSGPELSCSNCEWCWGADGQDLKPLSSAQSPDCPGCGHPGVVMVGGSQAFCGNGECDVLAWDMSRTPAENRASAVEVDLGDLDA